MLIQQTREIKIKKGYPSSLIFLYGSQNHGLYNDKRVNECKKLEV